MTASCTEDEDSADPRKVRKYEKTLKNNNFWSFGPFILALVARELTDLGFLIVVWNVKKIHFIESKN